MKQSPLLTLFLMSASATLLWTGITRAADLDWVGDTSSDFQIGTNWETDNLPNFATDILRFRNNSAPTTVTNVTVSLSNSGTGAGTTLSQILFEGSAPAYTLGGGTISLPSGTHNNAIVLSTGSTVTQTIASNILIGNGAAATTSVVNSSITGGLLKITGNITGGTGAGTPGIIAFSFGNVGTHNGNYQVTGNITAGGATGITLTKRGSGTVELSGNNTVGNLFFGSTAATGDQTATYRFTGGTTNLNATNGTSGWGTNSGNRGVSTNMVRVSGGILNTTAGRAIYTSLLIDGGTLNFNTGADRFSLIGGTGQTFAISSGAVNFNPTTGFGIRFGGDNGAGSAGVAFAGTQSSGIFTVNGTGGADTTFSLGSTTAGITTSYALSGGTLDIKGSDNTNGHLTLGADAAGTSTTTFTLSGNARLLVRSGTSGLGINGRTGSAIQNFDFTGGTLVAGEITTANLRATGDALNGVFTNQGGKLAPGDIGTTGRTTITGDYAVTSGLLTIDLGGLSASTAFQDAALSGKFDQLAITGNFAAGGMLGLNLVDAFNPAFGDIFKIVDVTGAGVLSSFFSNVADGGTLMTLGNEGRFKVYSSGNDIYLTNFTAVPESRAALLGCLGLLVGLRRRRN
jgi:hypothetical protein